MKCAAIALVSTSLLASYIGQRDDSVPQDKADLKGNWVIVHAMASGEKVPLETFERDVKSMKWRFSNDSFKAFVGGDKSVYEEGTYKVLSRESPKHLDMLPTKGEILTTRKCLYSVKGDELKIAFSANFAPGTEEEEIRRAKEMRAKRPMTLDPRPMNSTLILTFKRQKGMMYMTVIRRYGGWRTM